MRAREEIKGADVMRVDDDVIRLDDDVIRVDADVISVDEAVQPNRDTADDAHSESPARVSVNDDDQTEEDQ